MGNKACVDCHPEMTRLFPSSPHARFHRDDLRGAEETGCESCHGPGSRHVGAGGGRGKFIINPRNDPAPCFQCHLAVHADFRLPHRHPVVEGRLHCGQCHDPHGRDILKPARGLAITRLNESCAECHREQTRPFVFEHEALREGCVTCHHPHGSFNRKMLVERDLNLCLKCHAQMPVAGGGLLIGSAFHGPNPPRLQQGACWSAGCHTAVHGSNTNPRLLY